MAHKGPKNPERSFGLSVGMVLLLIAAYAVWRGRFTVAEVTGGIGTVLVLLGYLRPMLLYYPSLVWWKFAMALGYVNARVILTIAFTIVLVPISMAWRLIGRDPLQRRRDQWPGWTPYPPRYRNAQHFEKMY